jgi:uncharacterized DUF497 family protein
MSKTIISADGRFEWDEEKNALNKAKHSMEFHEILSVFDDPYILERFDRKNSSALGDRFIGIGTIGALLVVVCCYTERNSRTRIYSARQAEPRKAGGAVSDTFPAERQIRSTSSKVSPKSSAMSFRG